MSIVAPPSEAMARVWFTRRSASPSSNLILVVSTNVASRVCLVSWAIRSMAQPRVLVLSQSVAPGARYHTFVTRFGLTTSWNVAAPLGQSVPRLIGLSGLPSMLTILLSRTATSSPQPTAQYGQTLGTSRMLRKRDWRASAWAVRKSKPRPSRPPAAPRKARRSGGTDATDMAAPGTGGADEGLLLIDSQAGATGEMRHPV